MPKVRILFEVESYGMPLSPTDWKVREMFGDNWHLSFQLSSRIRDEIWDAVETVSHETC